MGKIDQGLSMGADEPGLAVTRRGFLKGSGGTALALTMTLVVALKTVHDYVKERNARLIDRYLEVVGRISALLIGTIAVEMILAGGGNWLREMAVR